MAKASDDAPRITRIIAGGGKKITKITSVSKEDKPARIPKRRGDRRNPLGAIGRYLKGSWVELRAVRWPDRKNTWKMTGALIAFTFGFSVLILIIDAGFQYIFNVLLGK